jgi:PHD/YefM family antitoxin component YafN of YafNO toxin-antitoxin module
MRDLMQRVVEKGADRLVLAALRAGSPRVIVLPADEYEAFIETLEVEEDPEALDDLRAGEAETAHGLPPTWDEVREEFDLGSRQADHAV